MKFKRSLAKLRQVVRESKRQFWNSVSQRKGPPVFYIKYSEKSRATRIPPSPDSHFCLENFLSSDVALQSELFAGHFTEETAYEPLPIDYGYEV